MIQKAVLEDLEEIEATYDEHFSYEAEHGAFTVFRKGIYPTRKDAESAIRAGTLYVARVDGRIAGSVIVDHEQPPKYAEIPWPHAWGKSEVMVIHLLMVRPSMSGRGLATSLLQFSLKLATDRGCKAMRLDTGSQNIPAVSLYQKLGFQVVASASMKVGSAIEHSGHLFLEKEL